MRLKPEEIKKLATHCADILLKDKVVHVKIQRQPLIEAMVSEWSEHFEEERKIDEKADALFAEQVKALPSVDRRKAMGLIKSQLSKESNFILSGGNEGRFSQDKINFLAHLADDKLYDDDLVDFKDEDEGLRYFKRLLNQYFQQENAIDEKVRKKIQSLSNAPFEGSREWEVLFRKYREEEMRRMNHGE